MKVLLRADAGPEQGTGHVMRCLTLAEGLASRGHFVELMGSITGAPWLESVIASSGIVVHKCSPDSLELEPIVALEADWVVVDSYNIEASLISRLNEAVKCLAIVDGDSRGITASLYLDQNVGAEERIWPAAVREKLLAGHQYCLVRDAVLQHRRPRRGVTGDLAVVAFMGGTDPQSAILPVAESLAGSALPFDLTVICPPALTSAVVSAVAQRPGVKVLGPTSHLPEVLGGADLVVSAAGTSAWDICTMGIPAVFVAVVDNQFASLQQATAREVSLGVNAIGHRRDALTTISKLVDRLVTDAGLRQELSDRCLSMFDGLGKARVVEAMERTTR